MRDSCLAALFLVFCGVPALAQQSGDEVFVIGKEVELRSGKEVTGKVSRGQTLTVRSVKDDWLWIRQDSQRGWISRQEVIPADQALAYLSEQLKSKPDPVDFAIRGRLWFRRGKPHLALADLNDALRIDPTTAEIWCNRGSSWAVIGEHDKAIADFNEAIRLDPTAVCHFLNRGRVWRTLGQPDKALQDYDKAIELNPDIAAAYVDRGAALQDKGEYEKSIASLTQAITLGAEEGIAFHNRGLAYYNLGNRDQAIKDYDEAIRRDPDESRYFNQRGLAWHDEENYEKAMSDFDEAIRLNPRDALPVGNRGMVWASMGQYDKAIDDYTAAMRIDPNVANFYSNRGNAWFEKNEFDLAITDYSHAIHVDPNHAAAFLNRGSAYEEKGELLRALADYNSAIRIKPDFAFAYQGRADIRRKQKDFAGAVADYERSLRLNSENLGAVNSLAWLLATCSDAQIRDGKRAVEVATQMCEQTSWKQWAPLDTLAAACAEAGDFDAATRWQQLALEMAPPQFHDEVKPRLALYQAKLPYHEIEAVEIAPTQQSEVSIAADDAPVGLGVEEGVADGELDEQRFDNDIAELSRKPPEGNERENGRYGVLDATVNALSRSVRRLLPIPSGDDRIEDWSHDDIQPASVETTNLLFEEERLEETNDAVEEPRAEPEVVAELTPEGFPLPKDAKDVERQESIEWIIFRSQLKPKQISKFYQDRLAKSGFKPDTNDTFVDDELGVGSITLNRGEQYLHIVIQDGAPKSVTRVIVEGDAIAWPEEDGGFSIGHEEEESGAVFDEEE